MAQTYRVKLDGTDIYTVKNPSMTLLSPELTMEIGSAGSLSFMMLPDHVFYDSVSLLTSTIEVLEDDSPIWSGRPTEITTDFYGRRRVYAEGALAYLNDSVQGYQEYDSISIRTFFSTLISNHNASVPDTRQLTVGNITVTDKYVYRQLSYEQTYDAVKTMCLDTRGGYLVVRRSDGTNYIDWLKTLSDDGNQPVQYGYNLLDLSQGIAGEDVVTQILPLGENDDDGNPITVASVNGGSKIVADAELVEQYGQITQTVQFSGIESPSTLLSEAQEWLTEHQPTGTILDVNAADLHTLNEEYNPLKLGQKVRVKSKIHGFNKVLPIMRIQIGLDSAKKQVTLGSTPRRNLTEIFKDNATEAQKGKRRSGNGYSGGGYSGGGSGGGGGSGDDWKHWVGTVAQYNQIPVKDTKTFYFITGV